MESREFIRIIILSALIIGAQSCQAPTASEYSGVITTTTTTTSTGQSFASGTKAIKVITSNNSTTGSFYPLPAALPVVTPIPTLYPGYDGSTTYNPGISATRYYDVDDTLSSKPNWLLDVQMGVTSVTAAAAACAKFGDSSAIYDVNDFFRVSEVDCAVGQNGTGAATDSVFARIVLNRDTTYIGTAENLLIQIEYQASGLHLNSDGDETAMEDNFDQLWKVYWNSTLGVASPPKPFSVFIPPNYSACLQSGTRVVGAPGNCTGATYRGSPVRVRQIIIPLSALTTASVIQISRVHSRISQPANVLNRYVTSYCTGAGATNSPLCLGVVIRSITLMRI